MGSTQTQSSNSKFLLWGLMLCQLIHCSVLPYIKCGPEGNVAVAVSRNVVVPASGVIVAGVDVTTPRHDRVSTTAIREGRIFCGPF